MIGGLASMVKDKKAQGLIVIMGATLTALMIRQYLLSIKKTQLEIAIIERKNKQQEDNQ